MSEKVTTPDAKLLFRFFSKIAHVDDCCWQWTMDKS